MNRLAWPLLLLGSSAATAQELPALDARIISIPVRETGLIHLGTAPEVTQTILFAQGERIASVVLSDPSAFYLNVAGTGDSLALRAGGPSAHGVMTVKTDARTYDFELVAGDVRLAPPVVRLTRYQEYKLPQQISQASSAASNSSYRLSGSKVLRPTTISDDGAKTYIEWAGDKTMPATFALGPTGEEQMVDGYMREGKFTIDRVYQTLIFRIDKQQAKAVRMIEKKKAKSQKDRSQKNQPQKNRAQKDHHG